MFPYFSFIKYFEEKKSPLNDYDLLLKIPLRPKALCFRQRQ